MQINLKHHLKQAFADKTFLWAFIVMIIAGLVYCAYVGLSLQARDIQVAVHYTAFGEAHFYKARWYYLISFIVFGLVVMISHAMLMIKLFILERRQAAVLFGYITVGLFIVSWYYASSVLGIANI